MGINRRRLLIAGAAVAGGGLVLTWLRPDPRKAPLPGSPPGAFQPNAWLQVTTDGRIILQIDKAELGQGVITGFVTLLAEELDVPPGRISYQFAPVHPLFQDPVQLTGSSLSMRSRWLPIRETGARARQMLLAAAAARWQADPASLRTDGDGGVVDPRNGTRLGYAELAGEAARQPVPEQVRLREPKEWRWIGKQVARPDLPVKVTGEARYGLDVQLPGLLVAVVARPPRLLAHSLSHDASAALALPGVAQVVPIPTGIAVLGESFWHAQRGAAAIVARWDDGPLKGVSTETIRAGQARQLDAAEGHRVRNEGDVEAALVGASRVVEAEYALPYLAHACMEPMNATVWFHDGGCEAWVPNQGPDIVRQTLCDVSGLKRDDVTVHSTYAGGGFGRRATMEFVLEAGVIALQTDRPVKLIWPRSDDLQHTLYREATLHRLKGGLDADGTPVAWQHRLVAASLNRLVFPITTSLVIPSWVPRPLLHGLNDAAITVFDRLVGSMTAREGATSMPYAIPGVQVEVLEWNPGVPITIWRSVGFSYTCFAIESFVDELAIAAGRDPADFRRQHLQGRERHRAVLDLVLEKSAWGRPPAGRHQGLAIQEAFGSVVAQVAEISVEADGRIRVHRVCCAVDCGTAINPDVIRQQMEGAVLYGLTAALHGEIHIDDGAVRESNFHEYQLLRLADAPEVDTHIVPSTADPGGIGEVGVPPIAPAVANAVFAATGRRLRTLPLRL